MKNNNKILISTITGLAIACAIILIVGKKKNITYKREQRLDRIAEEGYEFAADILYPLNESAKKYKSDYDEIRNSIF